MRHSRCTERKNVVHGGPRTEILKYSSCRAKKWEGEPARQGESKDQLERERERERKLESFSNREIQGREHLRKEEC